MFKFIAIVLCLTGTQAARVQRAFSCGSQSYLTTDDGVVKSHAGFDAGHNYGKNLNCLWKIEAPPGNFVELVAQSFNVEDDSACAYDYLELFDGDGTDSPSLGKFCGRRFNPISSTGNVLTLKFVTDDDTQLSGFSMFYNFTTTIIHQCHSSEFQCANGKCVSSSFRCDNDDDCGDDSDERNCIGGTGGGSNGCDADEFGCANGQCVLKDWLCDGDDDCNDNSDEIPSNCQVSCGPSNQTGSSGVFTSPNYPNHYPSSAHCLFVISAPAAKSIQFSFDSNFHVEPDTTCDYDYVTVYADGKTYKHGPFCGDVAPSPFTIPGDLVYIEFDSDSSDEYTGFMLNWKAIDNSRRSNRGNKRLIVDQPCQNTINVTSSGFITSQNFGVSDYMPNTICTWHLITTADRNIRVTFNSFDLPNTRRCFGDHVTVFNGFDAFSDVLGQYCGHVIPPDLTSTGNEMVIFFYSDGSGESTGFNISYEAVVQTAPTVPTYSYPGCNGHYKYVNESSGFIASPGYDGLTPYEPNLNCSWFIEAPKGQVIRIKFRDFLTETIAGCTYDYVKVYDGAFASAPLLLHLCGLQFPDDVVSTGNSLFISFLSDPDFGGTGFNLTYNFKTPTARNKIGWLCIKYGCAFGFITPKQDEQTQSFGYGTRPNRDVQADTDYRHLTRYTEFRQGVRLKIYETIDKGRCSMFKCADGSCILDQMICNKMVECPDHTDEVICRDNSCGKPTILPVESNYKIVGGREAIPNSWPWMVSLRVNGTHQCGGAIIDDHWVITAAHCFEKNRRSIDWTIEAGRHSETKQEPTNQIRGTDIIIVHPHYNFLSSVNDIALIKVTAPFRLNRYVDKVCLPDRSLLAGEYGFVTGWGFIENTCCPGVLKQARLPVINNTLCNQPDHLGNQVTDDMFCAGYEAGGVDACQGDSGGPFVVKQDSVWNIQGITSFGSGCADVRSPGVYTRVYNYNRWIRQKVALNS